MNTSLLVLTLNLCGGQPASPVDLTTVNAGQIATVYCRDGGKLSTVDTFQMGHGACLKGPMIFRAIDGQEMFKLDAGADYPNGCASGQ